jgi:hypothetical protein
MPTDAEQQKLARLMSLLMNTNDFSFTAFRHLLERYQRKYKNLSRHNYLQEWEKLNVTAQ